MTRKIIQPLFISPKLISRREFLEYGGVLGLSCLLIPHLGAEASIEKTTLISSFTHAGKTGICLINLKDGSNIYLKMQAPPHSVIRKSIKNKNHYLGIPKNSNKALHWINEAFDRASEIPSYSADGQFYGHGCYSLDGKFLYTSERMKNEGAIVVRETDHYKVIDVIKLGPTIPHDLYYESNHLIITCESQIANLSFLEHKTHKVSHKIPFPSQHQVPRHITSFGKERYLIAPMARHGQPILFCSPFLLHEDKISEVKIPEKLRYLSENQILNITYQKEFNSFYSCCPVGGLIRFNSETLEVEAHRYIEGAGIKNLVYLKSMKAFLGNDSLGNNLFLIDPLTLKVRTLFSGKKKHFELAHMSLY